MTHQVLPYFRTQTHPIMSKKSKRPRLQTTVASDIIASTSQFTHSSNTATRTRQIVTTVGLESTKSTTLFDSKMDSDPFIPVTVDQDLPAGVEVLTNLKAQRYVNSVRMPCIFWSSSMV